MSVIRVALVVWLALAALAPAAPASGWASLRNDTARPLVVRELAADGGAGRGRTLDPGEVGMERCADGRRVLIYDPRRPDEPLYRGPLEGKPLSIRDDGRSVRLVPR